MIDSLAQPLPALPVTPTLTRPTAGVAGTFADTLRDSIGEVNRMQADATAAVNDLTTGRSTDLSGTMTAVEKGDLAFKTLLAIRSKLIDAYDELKAMPM